MEDLDAVFREVGEFGRYQKLILWLVLLPGVFPCGFHAYNQLFMAASPAHWCRIPELKLADQELARNLSIPLIVKDGQLTYSRCTMYDRNYSKIAEDPYETPLDTSTYSIIACKDGWTYDDTHYKNTVTNEWNLVCDKSFSATLALMLFGVGGLVGNLIFGYVQDGVGRKPAFFIYLFIQCFFGIATAFATNFFVWVLFRIGVGFTVPAILGTPYVLAIELIGSRHRTAVTIFINIAYSLSLITLAIVVWLVRDWRQIAIMTTLPFLPLFGFYWMLPESPRWLLSKRRFDKACHIFNKIARINRKNTVTVAELKRINEEQDLKLQCQKNYGIYDLFRHKNLRWKTIIITFIWFTNTSVYVGLSYYAPILGGDEFLNFFLAGAVELPTFLFLWPSMERWGRRWTLCVSMVIGGSACLATFLVKHDSAVTLGLYCIGKMGISSSFVVLPLMATELYPTVVRGLGMSISSVMGMLGPVFIPIVNYLGSDMLTLPLIIMGVLLVAGGTCSLLLPETLNQILPQTLEDGEKTKLDFFMCCTPPRSRKVINVQDEEL